MGSFQLFPLRSKSFFSSFNIPNDVDDKHLVEIAIVATVDYIVTRDNSTSNMLKKLFSSEGPEIISPEEFIKILNQKN